MLFLLLPGTGYDIEPEHTVCSQLSQKTVVLKVTYSPAQKSKRDRRRARERLSPQDSRNQLWDDDDMEEEGRETKYRELEIVVIVMSAL